MRDYERHIRKAAAFVRLAMIRVMLKRLAVSASACIQTSEMGSYTRLLTLLTATSQYISGWRAIYTKFQFLRAIRSFTIGTTP